MATGMIRECLIILQLLHVSTSSTLNMQIETSNNEKTHTHIYLKRVIPILGEGGLVGKKVSITSTCIAYRLNGLRIVLRSN